MKLLDRLYTWYGKRTVWAVATLVVILLIGVVATQTNRLTDESPTEVIPTVVVAMAGEQASQGAIELIGTVKAVDQAQIQTESAGRITVVNVRPGDFIAAGTIIAQQENASERAAVLQAEGVYEAALAAAASSDVSLSEARTSLKAANDNAVVTYQNSYTTAYSIMKETIDDFFADPESAATPGLKIDGGASTKYLNDERVAFRPVLADWRVRSSALRSDEDVVSALNEANTTLKRLLSMVDVFLGILADDDSVRLTEAEVASYQAEFSTARASLISSQNAIDAALSRITSSEEALRRAEIGSSGSQISSADAQVKQALGALRAAQANLEKTILRTPIAGTVNTLSVDQGDFVGSFTPVAEVANNNALEITTYVGEKDRSLLSVGSEVTLESGVSGVVTSIAPAVDSATQKIKVTIGTEDQRLKSGDTVTVVIEADNAILTDGSQPLYIPITAVKFAASDGVVFTVEDGVLVSQPVTVGKINGAYVEITSGLERQTVIVVDARGLSEGEQVEAVTE